MNQPIYLVCHHDRHTDDQFLAFWTEQEAKDQAYKWLDQFYGNKRKYSFIENEQFGDWCLFCSEDYYISVQNITLVARS